MNFETLDIEKDERGVTTVWLNRPDVHNAFNDQLIADLGAVFGNISNDDTTRVVLLRGRGKSFSAGADLQWMKAAASYSEKENFEDARRLSAMLNAINTCPKPVIAVVHGNAFGGGVGLTAVADMAIATRDARFALSEVRLGLTPATISPYVVAAIGERAARRYFLTAERFDGLRARGLGLVDFTVDDATGFDAAIERLLSDLLQNAPKAMAAAKKLISDVTNRPITDELRDDTAMRIAKRRTSSEAKEGLAAFFDKRKPNWVKHDD